MIFNFFNKIEGQFSETQSGRASSTHTEQWPYSGGYGSRGRLHKRGIGRGQGTLWSENAPRRDRAGSLAALQHLGIVVTRAGARKQGRSHLH